jgi:hypothetical protein
MAMMKKAKTGVSLRSGQLKRIGRLEAKNPDRATNVASRMVERDTRKERGQDFITKNLDKLMPKRAKSGGSFAALAPPYDKATFADKIAGAKKNAGKAKNGTAMKKMQYGGDVASMVPSMKKGGKAKKAGMHKMPDGSMMKNSMMKSGGKMGKCKYGCN